MYPRLRTPRVQRKGNPTVYGQRGKTDGYRNLFRIPKEERTDQKMGQFSRLETQDLQKQR